VDRYPKVPDPFGRPGAGYADGAGPCVPALHRLSRVSLGARCGGPQLSPGGL